METELRTSPEPRPQLVVRDVQAGDPAVNTSGAVTVGLPA